MAYSRNKKSCIINQSYDDALVNIAVYDFRFTDK